MTMMSAACPCDDCRSSLDQDGRDGPAWWVAGVCLLALLILAGGALGAVAVAARLLWLLWGSLGL